tara:strand:+ start:172 stop:609 length:438 start_codon:yes stop_codon:yes gene_type:complete
MKTYEVKRILNYSDSKIFDLVKDVEGYPKFLPWCKKANVYNKLKGEFYSDITIGFNLINETFTSKVVFVRPKKIISTATEGPFKKMINQWKINFISNSSCEVVLKIQYEFSSVFMEKILGNVFDLASKKMIFAFENRAKKLFDTN